MCFTLFSNCFVKSSFSWLVPKSDNWFPFDWTVSVLFTPMDSFNDLAANGGHNGQQMPQMSAESSARVRPPSDHYLTDHMPPQHRTHYNSPPMETQMRRPNTSYNDSISELTKQTNLLSFGVNDKNNYNSIGGAGDLSNNSWIASGFGPLFHMPIVWH